MIAEAFGGIATYSKHLLSALSRIKSIKTSAIWLFPPSDYQKQNISKFLPENGIILGLADPHEFKSPLEKILQEDPIDIVHFQYDVSIFPCQSCFLRLLDEIHTQTAKKVIITLHSTYIDLKFIKMLNDYLKLIDAYIVHQENAKNFLVSKGLNPSKIFIIPHGTIVSHDYPNRSQFFKTTAFKIAMVGFLKRTKAFGEVISSLSSKNDLEIIIAGLVKDPDIIRQIQQIRQQAEAKITLISRFLADEELEGLISEADCVILPYKQEYFSSSGILHLAAGLKKIILVSPCPKFRELATKIPFCEVKDGNYLERIEILQHSPKLANHLVEGIELFAKETSWQNVAEQTFKLYQSVLNEEKQ